MNGLTDTQTERSDRQTDRHITLSETSCLAVIYLFVVSKSPEDVEKMGVAVYNDECRKIVMRYSQQWEVSHMMDW